MSTFMPHAHCTNTLLTSICQHPQSATCNFSFFSCCLWYPILTDSSGFGEVNLSSCIASELGRFQPQSQSSTDPLPHSSALSLSQISLLSGSSALSAVSDKQYNSNSYHVDPQQAFSKWASWKQNQKCASNQFIFPPSLFVHACCFNTQGTLRGFLSCFPAVYDL